MSPVFYMFNDRERAFDIVEAVTGGRMHPGWFRIGGVAQDLPEGWETLVRDFLDYLPRAARGVRHDGDAEPHLQGAHRRASARSRRDEAIEWGVTGPMPARLRAWSGTSARSGPTAATSSSSSTSRPASSGDCYDRAVVRVEEMRQSLRIIEQCVKQHARRALTSRDHPLATPPLKERTMHDIETLIDHFLGVSWGPVIPPGEASVGVEGDQGAQQLLPGQRRRHGCRTGRGSARRRFPHIQMLPLMAPRADGAGPDRDPGQHGLRAGGRGSVRIEEIAGYAD